MRFFIMRHPHRSVVSDVLLRHPDPQEVFPTTDDALNNVPFLVSDLTSCRPEQPPSRPGVQHFTDIASSTRSDQAPASVPSVPLLLAALVFAFHNRAPLAVIGHSASTIPLRTHTYQS
jgi:hypothetical protein